MPNYEDACMDETRGHQTASIETIFASLYKSSKQVFLAFIFSQVPSKGPDEGIYHYIRCKSAHGRVKAKSKYRASCNWLDFLRPALSLPFFNWIEPSVEDFRAKTLT